MDPRHVTRSYIFIEGEILRTIHFFQDFFLPAAIHLAGLLRQPLFKIRIAESLQIDFFGIPFHRGGVWPRRLELMDFIIITFF